MTIHTDYDAPRDPPKRHFLVVEITDVERGQNTKQVAGTVRDAIERGLYEHGLGSYYSNIQVKSFARVMSARKIKEKKNS